MDRDLGDRSRPFRQGYSARASNRPAHENPYLGAADLAGMYARQQWVEGWKEADGDRTVRRKINAASQEIADEIKRSSDEACRKD
jgi:ribosome modulation factor